jgi:hypothetical protein
MVEKRAEPKAAISAGPVNQLGRAKAGLKRVRGEITTVIIRAAPEQPHGVTVALPISVVDRVAQVATEIAPSVKAVPTAVPMIRAAVAA